MRSHNQRTVRKSKIPFFLKVVRWVFPRLEKVFPALAHRFFVTIFFTPLSYPVPERERMIEQDAQKFSIRVSGRRIQCYSWGQGPVVLLVHGWAGRATQFRAFIPALVRANFRVVGFDGPAHGRSDGRKTDIIGFEEVLKVLYTHIGVPEGIIAHSFGGGVVLFAAMNGLQVKKLINIASPTIGDEIIQTYLKTIRGSAETGRVFRKYVQQTTGKPFDAFTSLHFISHLKQDVKLLLVHDEDDAEVSINHALELLKRYPQASLYTTRGLGHTRILKDEAVIEKCVSFLKS